MDATISDGVPARGKSGRAASASLEPRRSNVQAGGKKGLAIACGYTHIL